MTKTPRKHYFFTASLTFVAVFVLLSLISPFIFSDPKKVSKRESLEEIKADALNSIQKKVVVEAPQKVLNEERKPASVPQVRQAKKNVKPRRRFTPNFLKKRNGDYLWQPHIYAIPKNDGESVAGRVLGQFDKFSIVDTRGTPEGALPIIWSNKYRRYGIYTGKIIILTDQTGVAEYLKDRGHRYSNLSGSYIVNIHSLDEAFDVVQKIRNNFPKTLVDIDINMDQARAK